MLRFVWEATLGLYRFPGLRQVVAKAAHQRAQLLARCSAAQTQLCGSGGLHRAAGRAFSTNNHIDKVPFSYQNSQTYSSSSSARPPVEGELIYTGNLSNAVFGVKLFSYGSSLFNLCVVPAICLKTGFEFGNVALQLAGFSVLCVFTFITPVLLHLFSKRYVVRLYHNADTDTYTAVTYNVLLLEKKTVFHQKDVKIPDVSKMFTTFYANRKAMIVNPMLFTVQNDYHHLMGYDQPYSFDMEDN